MFETIFSQLDREMIVLGSFLFGLLILLAMRRPEIIFALGLTAYLFLGQLKEYFPVSNSAAAAMFPLAAAIGSILRGDRLHLGRCEKLIIGLAILMALSIYYSPNPMYGQNKTVLFCFMAVPVVIFAPNIITSLKSLQTVASIIVLTLIIFVFASLFVRWQLGSVTERVAGLLDETVASHWLGMSLIIAYLYIILMRYQDIRKVTFIFILPISGILLLMTGTRAAVLAVIVTVLFMYWFVHIDWFKRIFNQPRKTCAIIVLGALIVLTVPFVMSKILPEEVYSRFTSIDNFFSNFTPDEISDWQNSNGRTLNYFSSAKSFSAHPLAGVGAGGYKSVLADFGNPNPNKTAFDDLAHAYPHNILLEFAVEEGVFGLILILYVLYLNTRMIFRIRNVYHTNPQGRFLICFCISIYIYGLCLSMTALDTPQMMILWWGMGLLLATDRIHTQQALVPRPENKRRLPVFRRKLLWQP